MLRFFQSIIVQLNFYVFFLFGVIPIFCVSVGTSSFVLYFQDFLMFFFWLSDILLDGWCVIWCFFSGSMRSSAVLGFFFGTFPSVERCP